MTIIYECREVNNKVLLFQFQFESHKTISNENEVNSLDKYLSIDIWLQIYEKFRKPLETYIAHPDNPPKDETIVMKRAQLELRLTWKKTRSFHTEIIRQEKKNVDNWPSFLSIKVRMISALDTYKKMLSKRTSGESLASLDLSAEANHLKADPLTDNVEEYVPSSRTAIKPLIYNPSSNGSGTSANAASDEYTPSVPSSEEVVSYTPTRIDGMSKTGKANNPEKTDLNRNVYIGKKKRTEDCKINDLFGGDSDDMFENDSPSQSNLHSVVVGSELFGDDSGELHKSVGTSHRNLRSATKSSKRAQGNLDGWVTARRPKDIQSDMKSTAFDETKKKRKIAMSTPAKEPGDKLKKLDEEAKKLKALREEWEKREKKTVIDRIRNLKDLSVDEICATFSTYESVLSMKYRQYLNVPDHRVDPRANGYDYLLILDGLVTDEQTKAMYMQLRGTFCKNDKESITTNHENLFWTLMVPEWSMQIFMDHFELSRDEAIEVLQDQDKVKIENNSSLDDF